MDTLESLLALPQAILFECIAGSRAYGTATADSDEDIRGIFAVRAQDYLSLQQPRDQVSDARNNVVYYSLRRVIELLSQANPNILELLFMPPDCTRRLSPEMELLIERRSIFISKQCVETHAGYAMAQIKKANARREHVGEHDLDAKDMMHIMRLLMSCQSILTTGEPLVRFTGAEFELLMTIRAGKRTFEDIMMIADAILDECQRLKQSSDLPERCDVHRADQLLHALTDHWERRCKS